MRVEAVKPVNGVKVHIVGDESIYMRQNTHPPLWYEPDIATMSLKMLVPPGGKYDELEAAYQIYLDNYGGL